MGSVLLNAGSLAGLAAGKSFRDNAGTVNSLDFHRSEDLLVTASACSPALG